MHSLKITGFHPTTQQSLCFFSVLSKTFLTIILFCLFSHPVATILSPLSVQSTCTFGL